MYQIPSALRSDILAAKKDVFVMAELKTSQKNIRVFSLTLPEYIYYNRAYEADIPVKLILVNLLNNVYVSICRYQGEISNLGLFRVKLFLYGLESSILKRISENKGTSLAEITKIPKTSRWLVKEIIRKLELAGLVFEEKNKYYTTNKGLALLKLG